MKFLVFLALLGAINCHNNLFNLDLDKHWEDFKRVFGKSYSSGDESLRRINWEKNVVEILQHNVQADLGLHTYRRGLNEYSDMSFEELMSKMMGLRSGGSSKTNGSTWVPPSNVQLPDKVDWRDQGLVTPVKNQVQCGSCWAFSSTGSLEGQHMKKTGKLVSLSEQNLVDCAEDDGCGGGWMDDAFEYVKDNKGIDTEEAYPYTAKVGKCQYKKEDVGATCTGFVDIPAGDENALQLAVATVGPIAVAVDASHTGFAFYKSGIYDEPLCKKDEFNHAVLVVGYGTLDGTDYWLVKNSWGETWGMKGYILMSRNKDNQCGIANKASYPLV